MRRYLGSVGVDSGTLMISDPCYVLDDGGRNTTLHNKYPNEYEKVVEMSDVAIPLLDGLALCVAEFGGDGRYKVFGEFDERGLLAKVEIDFNA